MARAQWLSWAQALSKRLVLTGCGVRNSWAKKAHPQLLKQPAKLQHALVRHPFAFGHQAPIALLLRPQLAQALGVSGRVGAPFVQPQHHRFEVARKVL